ncbi:MAG: hypothetical protein ABIJ56_08145 [Pseudomonadota bacterium]
MTTRDWQLKVTLFIVSVCLLCLEILHIRIFGYAAAPILSYCAISFAMLGFAGGAAIVSIFPRILKWDVFKTVIVLCVLFSLSIYLSGGALAVLGGLSDPVKKPDFDAAAVFTLLPSLLPYLFTGLIVAVIFSTLPSMSGEIYFINLLGSAVGCLIPLFLLRRAGAELLLGAVAAGSFAACLPLLPRLGRSLRLALAAAALAAAAAIPLSGRLFDFKPDPTDQISVLSRVMEKTGREPPVRETSLWDPVGRIEVYKTPGGKVSVPEKLDYRIIVVDAGASTLMVHPPEKKGWGRELFEDSLYGIGYHVTKRNPDVLVIGVGGGTDIQTAVHWGAKSVTGVEISLSTIRLLETRYRDFARLTGPGRNVELVHADGRNYAKNTQKRFDLIQLTGVDTLTLSSPGAMVLVEDYLYTVEAFRDFLSILKPEGTLVVLRFDSEPINLGAIAFHALKSLGVDNPYTHIVAINQGRLAGIMVSGKPFSDRKIEAVRTMGARTKINEITIPHYDYYGVRLGDPINIIYLPRAEYFEKLKTILQGVAGRPGMSGLRKRLLSFQIPTDDKPYYMAGRIIQWLQKGKAVRSLRLIRNTWLMILVLSSLFLLLPLLSGARKYPLNLSSLSLLFFFFSIAVGFMFVEIGLIQKTIIFIGYPGGSATLVLAALLLGTGTGSYVSGRLRLEPARLVLIAAPAAFLVIVLHTLAGGGLFEALAGMGALARWLACCLLIFLVGIPMGFMYPSGLRTVNERFAMFVPWAISVNGFASASASVIALPTGIFAGHTFLIITGGCFYLLAAALMGLYLLKRGPQKA